MAMVSLNSNSSSSKDTAHHQGEAEEELQQELEAETLLAPPGSHFYSFLTDQDQRATDGTAHSGLNTLT